jgi:hypothetical protein
VERDGSFKKQALSQAGGGDGYAADDEVEKRKPSKFMAWNANNFLLHLKSYRDEVLSLLHRLDLDVIVIQVKKNYHLFFSLCEKICSPFALSQKICSPSALWFDKAPPTTIGTHYFLTHTMLQELRRSWCFQKIPSKKHKNASKKHRNAFRLK